ncbi:MAG: fibronectin type III domain-containing protein, partial [Janthinobacterium lividum]
KADLVDTAKRFVDNARKSNPNVKIVMANAPQRTTLGAASDLPERTRDYNAALAAAIPTWSTSRSPIVMADFDKEYGCDGLSSKCDSTYDGLHPNALGEYRIARAFEVALQGKFGIGGSVPAIPAVPARVLTTPANVKFNATDQGVGASWSPVYGARNYDVEWRDITDNADAAWTGSGTGGIRWDKSWQFLQPNFPGHTFQVRVRSSAGSTTDMKSAWSAPVQGVSDPHIAPPPTNITTTSTATGVDVGWVAPTGANTDSITRYAIWVWDGSLTNYPKIVGYSKDARTAHIDGLIPGQKYTIFMVTWNAHGEGLPAFGSGVVVGAVGAPPTPTGLVVTSTDATTVKYSWNPSPGAGGYRVWMRNVNDAASVSTPGSVQTSTSGGAAFLVPGVWNYEVCVTAVNGTYESGKTCKKAPRPAGS